jgi:hypothetical protein
MDKPMQTTFNVLIALAFIASATANLYYSHRIKALETDIGAMISELRTTLAKVEDVIAASQKG